MENPNSNGFEQKCFAAPGQQPADIFGEEKDCKFMLYYFFGGGQNGCNFCCTQQLNTYLKISGWKNCPVAHSLV